MIEKCPICRAGFPEGAVCCRRCGAEMTWILETLRLGRRLRHAALEAMMRGDRAKAMAWGRRARWVHSTPFSRVLDQFLVQKSKNRYY